MLKVLILGLGNPLLKDDGIGPRVIRAIKAEKLPAGVCAMEAGGSCFVYWDLLLQCQHVIAIDSLLGDGPPGSVYVVKPEYLQIKKHNQMRHEQHFLDVLEMASWYGARPKTIIIGVEPEEITFSLELSQTVQGKMPHILSIINKKMKALLPASSF
ncbi:hydrogenase maturation protease [Desulfotomaculum arcticum]|uniref:Hydrogenase maturation protease n=1 Tax=Desulfotruncus arcticus DSM 17038 TaxID=1121424 RepID=A0A1I2XDX7_9FIRM|nr:hydrogenase maturation protease [Desulfotruncus arcticus]SFH11703.1 hydrogenase maturation protease [Desulfotomaculum arcticum] [Desulfotruncus arcticus DSM 17038]